MVYHNFIDLLNDLIRINNDRIAGYEKAVAELKEEQDNYLKSIFGKMIIISHDHNTDLARLVDFLGGEATTGTTGAGKLYRLWLDVKTIFTGITDKRTVLEVAEKVESAARNAYKEALNEPGLPDELSNLLIAQEATLTESEHQIRALRNASSG
ncbi:PA2169 family four-helix-bundle protein [Niabella soli]|uniref:Aldehyde dehydrogenase n=1 Tax=Niabella soli DSM 19437 TaxID=929713 RepID=W0EUA0_9BACT|nr:PA2169 family four-helix-bundle protein [Niabella soli]AHF14357.1 aldehyde dehydrogenase [Niabella soli DSM 19437]